MMTEQINIPFASLPARDVGGFLLSPDSLSPILKGCSDLAIWAHVLNDGASRLRKKAGEPLHYHYHNLLAREFFEAAGIADLVSQAAILTHDVPEESPAKYGLRDPLTFRKLLKGCIVARLHEANEPVDEGFLDAFVNQVSGPVFEVTWDAKGDEKDAALKKKMPSYSPAAKLLKMGDAAATLFEDIHEKTSMLYPQREGVMRRGLIVAEAGAPLNDTLAKAVPVLVKANADLIKLTSHDVTEVGAIRQAHRKEAFLKQLVKPSVDAGGGAPNTAVFSAGSQEMPLAAGPCSAAQRD